MQLLGPGSEVRSGKPLTNLPFYCDRTCKSAHPGFGIRSVSVARPYPITKTRYLSSAYCPGSVLSQLLIIGGSKRAACGFEPFWGKQFTNIS